MSSIAQWNDSGVSGVPASVSPASVLFDTESFDAMDRMAAIMASGSVSIPQHLRGKKGDCFAIVMQSCQWGGMNPFSVAQKTHLSQSGQLGYEAQLINAVVCNLAPIEGRPDYEFIGDWSKVLGKVKEERSEKGGKYYSATYTRNDEDGLGVIIRATLRGEAAPREITVMLSQCYPRFSTQWATDPQQQICYVAVRKWARRYTPDVLLGVYTAEELDAPLAMRDMGRAEEIRKPAARAGSRTDSVRAKLASQRNAKPAAAPSIDAIIRNIEAATTAHELTMAIEPVTRLASEADKVRAREAYALKLKSEKERATAEAEPETGAYTYAAVADRLQGSEGVEELDEAADLIRAVADPEHRDELTTLYHSRRQALEKS
ncbi:RecT family recombinase [Paraburkholderia sp. BR14320]|uniref:RecT family recombinase n=1 Tax=unclassified Paraburkholderia TaxID=2615204 RepID=UPI0034CFD938